MILALVLSCTLVGGCGRLPVVVYMGTLVLESQGRWVASQLSLSLQGGRSSTSLALRLLPRWKRGGGDMLRKWSSLLSILNSSF